MGLCQAWLRFKSFCSGAIIFLTFSLLSGTWRSIRASSPAAPSILPWPHKKKTKPVSPHAGKRWQKIRKASLPAPRYRFGWEMLLRVLQVYQAPKMQKAILPRVANMWQDAFRRFGSRKKQRFLCREAMPVHTRFQTHPQTTTHIFACPFCGPRLPRDSNPSIHSSASPQATPTMHIGTFSSHQPFDGTIGLEAANSMYSKPKTETNNTEEAPHECSHDTRPNFTRRKPGDPQKRGNPGIRHWLGSHKREMKRGSEGATIRLWATCS